MVLLVVVVGLNHTRYKGGEEEGQEGEKIFYFHALMILPEVQRTTLLKLCDEFIAACLETPDGRSLLALYERSVREGRQHYKSILSALDSGEDITDMVLTGLLPHRNTLANVKRGAWIHVTPAVQGDLRQWFQRRGWIAAKNWSRVARDIFRFVHNCIDDPQNVDVHCAEFSSIPYIKGIQCGYLTPILEAVKPKRFVVVTPKSIRALKLLTGVKGTTSVADYPETNARLLELMEEIGDSLATGTGLKRIPPVRLFNLFSWWLSDNAPDPKSVPSVYTVPETTLPKAVKEPQPLRDKPKSIGEPLTLEATAAVLHLPQQQVQRWVHVLREKKQMILYGPPGTGKTWIAEHLAQHFVEGTEGLRETVQFHSSWSYEDFIQGIRPQRSEEGGLDYPVVEGRFLRFCREARMAGNAPCVMVVDEINRANLSQVFGELMYLLEYRNRTVRLSGDGKQFAIPENVYLIGTMNTADRSIALVDYALRRRFAFIELEPDYDLLRAFYSNKSGSAAGVNLDGLIALLKAVNTAIDDRGYLIGISFFLRESLQRSLQDVWQTEIEPYLDEFFVDDPGKVDEFRWKRIATKVLQ